MKLKPLAFIGAFISATVTAHSGFAAPFQQAYLKASNPGLSDTFGNRVAISGDTVVVGAPAEASDATGVNGDQANDRADQSGAAYVFVRNGTNWSQQAYLKASTAITNGNGYRFGSSVSVSDDTIAVGATHSREGGPLSPGAVYIFVRSGTNWSQQAYLTNYASQQILTFGSTVAVSANTVVVGTSSDDSNATGVNGNPNNHSAYGAGAAHVFVRTGTNWTRQAYLKASNAAANDNFGFAVSLFGDTVVVGARHEDSNATEVNGSQSNDAALDSGAAYVFVRTGTNWVQQAYLKASNTGANDAFGCSVAVSSNSLVVGAYLEDSNTTGVNGSQTNNTANGAGAAYVFVRTGTNWNQAAYLKASNSETADYFGQSVAVSGDTVVIGAEQESSDDAGVNGDENNNNAPRSGAVYAFTRTGTNWTQQAYLKASNPGGVTAQTQTGDHFGFEVAVSDGTSVVGAPFETSSAPGVNGNESDNSLPGAGAAYVFAGMGTGIPTSPPYFINPRLLENGTFQFGFHETAGTTHTVIATTDLATPANAWTVLGSATETPPGSGQFQFTEPQAANHPQRFYRVRSP